MQEYRFIAMLFQMIPKQRYKGIKRALQFYSYVVSNDSKTDTEKINSIV